MFSEIRPAISSMLRKSLRPFSSIANATEQKVNVKGIQINYVKSGSGEKAVLLLPGALGSNWTDFKPQIDGLPTKLPGYSIVAWDPPGYGRSIPPARTFPTDFFHKDADWANSLMTNSLGFRRYSVLGWSDGGITGMILAAKYPNAVDKLVVWGSNAYVLPEELKIYDGTFQLSQNMHTNNPLMN